MTTITLINWTDNIKDSRSVINNNFTNLNNDKVEKEAWKSLIETTKITKLDWIEPWAEVNVKSDWNSISWDSEILNKPTIPTKTSDLTNDSLLSDIIAGANITIDKTDPLNPIISSTWWGGGGWWDMLKSENLSWLANYTTARSNLWLWNVDNTSDINKPISTATQTALDWKVDENTTITWATKTKITYDSKWLVTAWADLIESDIPTLSQSKITNLTTDLGNKQPLATVLTNTTASYTTTIDTRLANTSWTNTWDNATNTQYSWLATSKQDNLVSWTNIKTVNWASLLWSWNITISGWSSSIRRILTVWWTIWTTWTNVWPDLIIDWTYTISQVNMWYWTVWNWTLTVDINKNWTSICSTTKPSITWTNKYSINTWTLTTTSLASWDSITIDIDAVPWTPWTDLYVEIIYS